MKEGEEMKTENENLQKLDRIMKQCMKQKQTYADYQKNLYKDYYDVKKNFRKKVNK